MKKLLLTGITVTTLLFLTSCGGDGDDPAPAHEVGTWELDSYALQGFPTGFESNEGLILTLDQITFGGVQFQGYELTLNSDGTYSRSIEITGPDVDDNGTYTLEGDDLELESEDGDFQEFDVVRNEDDDLWLSQRDGITSSFIPDIYFDTVTQTYIDFLQTLTEAQLDSVNAELSEVLELDLVFVLERK